MLLVAVLVLTSTVSADGSVGGMYRASIKLAEKTYVNGASSMKGLINQSEKQGSQNPVESKEGNR
jgi:hypothetical protein